MKQLLLSVVALMAATALMATPRMYVNESFEQGLPATWTQEVVSVNSQLWQVESSSLTYPKTAYDGAARIALRNNTGMTKHFVTRLITPEMDFSNYATVYNPMLTFAYVQPARSGMMDTLRVYYRQDANDSWHLLKTYDTPVNSWQVDTIYLVATNSAAYQVAFEGSENLGRGVMLDDIKVINSSQCTGVTGMVITPKTYAADIEIVSMDMEFEVLVSETRINDMAAYDIDDAVWHQAGIQDIFASVTGLQSNTLYYIYARSVCDDNESGYTDWYGAQFKTSLGFPYAEDFSMMSSFPDGWQEMQGELAVAYLNAADLESAESNTSGWSVYSQSGGGINGRHAMCDPYYLERPLWLISPVIDLIGVEDEAIDLRFDLSITASDMQSNVDDQTKLLHRFYVLISEDGGLTWTKLNTTEWGNAVSDISITQLSATPHRYRVDMAPFIGHNVRIAFVGKGLAFGTRAYFHLGNIALDSYDASCGIISSVRVNTSDTAAVMTWQMTGTQPVVIELAEDEDFLYGKQTYTTTGTSFTFNSLTPGTRYYVRLRQNCSDSEWNTRDFNTAVSIPYDHPFTTYLMPEDWTRYTGVTASDLFNEYDFLAQPVNVGWSINQRGSVYGMANTNMAGVNIAGTQKAWLVSPNIYLGVNQDESVRLCFKQALSNSASPSQSMFSDQDDEFIIAISTDNGETWSRSNALVWNCTGDGDYDLLAVPYMPQQVTVDLSRYVGQTIRIAFYAASYSAGSSNNLFLGDMKVETYDPNCGGVLNLTSTIVNNTVDVNWQTMGNPQVTVYLSEDAMFTQILDSAVSSTGSAQFGNLSYNSYYFIRVVQNCDENEWAMSSIRTLCGPETAPYINDFEDEVPSTDPACWTIMQYQNYPTIGVSGSHAHSGQKFLSWGTTDRYYEPHLSWASLPELDDISSLELAFYMRAATAQAAIADTIMVGVMTDPTDSTTFEEVASFRVSGTAYQLYTVDFSYYYGSGKYITLMCKPVSHMYTGRAYSTPVIIDDIEVAPIPSCQRMGTVETYGLRYNGSGIRYRITNAPEYQIIVATEPIDPDLAASHPAVVLDTMVQDDHLLIYGDSYLPNTDYYVYVRGYCGGDDYSTWSDQAHFHTLCPPVGLADLGTVTFDSDEELACWHFGYLGEREECRSDRSYTGRSAASQSTYGDYLELSKKEVDAADCFQDNAYAIMPELDLGEDSITKYQLSFRAVTTSKSAFNVHRLHIGVLTGMEDFDTYEVVKTIDLEYAANRAGEREYTVNFSSYIGDYNGEYGRIIMFMGEAGTDSTNYVLIDDVTVERAVGCPQIIDVNIDSTSMDAAHLVWEDVSAEYYQVRVSQIVTNRPDTIPASQILFAADSVLTPAVLIDGLEAQTRYYAYVRGFCGDDFGRWSAAKTVRTSIAVPYLEAFDSYDINTLPIDEWRGYRSVELKGAFRPADWDLNMDNTQGWNMVNRPTSITNMANTIMRVELRNPSYDAVLTSPQVILRGTDPDLGYQLTFRLALLSGNGTSATTVSNHQFQVMISEDGGNSYLPIYTWNCDGTGDGDYNSIRQRSIRAEIDLTAYAGKTVSLAFYTASSSGIDQYLYMDSVAINQYDASCIRPNRLQLTPLSATEVAVSWEHSATYQGNYNVQVSDNAQFTTLALDTTVATDGLTVSQLTAGVPCYVRVQRACGSDWVQKMVNMPYQLPYLPVIPTNQDVPDDWSRGAGDLVSIIAGKSSLHGATTGWRSVNADGIIADSHLRINIQSMDVQHWAITPIIDLTDHVGDTVVLNFDAYLTAYNATYKNDRNKGDDDQFAVVISTDNGATWQQVALWNNLGTGDYILNNIPETGDSYTLNLMPYTGHMIRLALYAESTKHNANNYLHVGNLRVEVGALPECLPIVYRYSATLCEGEKFEDDNFNFVASKSTPSVLTRVYQVEGGCDSTVALTVTVYPKSNTALTYELCEGDTLTIDGQDVFASGVYYENLTTVHGCDSTVIWSVNLIPQPKKVIYDTIPQSALPYYFGTESLTESGDYQLVLPSASGCDSLVILHLTVVPNSGISLLNATDRIDVAPNPVHSGESIRIMGEFTPAEIASMQVALYALTGEKVAMMDHVQATFPMVRISDACAPGMYLLRITTENHIYLAMILVE